MDTVAGSDAFAQEMLNKLPAFEGDPVLFCYDAVCLGRSTSCIDILPKKYHYLATCFVDYMLLRRF